MNCVIILGNGFDINLGWDTRYKTFYRNHNGWVTFKTDEDDLFQYVIKEVWKNWFDFEQTLYKYVQHRFQKPAPAEIVTRDLTDYNALKSELMKFISDAAKGEINVESHAYRLLEAYVESRKGRFSLLGYNKLYSFNYTPLLDVFHKIDPTVRVTYTPVHGRTVDESIIFGFHDAPNVPREYRFLQKSMDVNYKSSDMVKESLKADTIVFFGLSLGYIDGVYFKNLFNQLSNQTNPQMINKHIFFITKDMNSEEDCKNNLLDMGINLQLLYNTNEVHFIYTDTKEKDKTEEVFAKLIKNVSDN